MRAKVSWVEGMRFVGAGDSGHGVLMESKSGEAPAIGASPMEIVLIALGGCSAVDIVDILRKMRQDLSSLEVVVHAERAPEPPRVFVRAELEFVASGEGLTDASLKRAVDLSMDKYCSVAAMLKKSGTNITYRFRLKLEEPPAADTEPPKGGLPGGRGPIEAHPQAAADLPFPDPPGPRPHGKNE